MKRATQPFFPGDGAIVSIDAVYADDHPLVVMYPGMFVEVEVFEKPARRGRPPAEVEQATAAPGEKRGR